MNEKEDYYNRVMFYQQTLFAFLLFADQCICTAFRNRQQRQKSHRLAAAAAAGWNLTFHCTTDARNDSNGQVRADPGVSIVSWGQDIGAFIIFYRKKQEKKRGDEWRGDGDGDGIWLILTMKMEENAEGRQDEVRREKKRTRGRS